MQLSLKKNVRFFHVICTLLDKSICPIKTMTQKLYQKKSIQCVASRGFTNTVFIVNLSMSDFATLAI